jgi:hypothetical protein
MAGIDRTSEGNILLKVNAIMVMGSGDSANGKVHHIIVSSDEIVPSGKQEHMVIPFKLHNNIISTIQRILTSKGLNTHNITIDTRLKDGDNLCNDLSSLGLSIAIGIESSLDSTGKWQDALKKWCFTGEVDASSGDIVRIGGAKAKLESASRTESITNIMLPSGNRDETISWISAKGYDYREKTSSDVKVIESINTPSVLRRMWSLATKNLLLWTALVFWCLSIIYIPIRFTLWDSVMSWKSGAPQVTVSVPVQDRERLGRSLINSGFAEEQVQKFVSSTLAGSNLDQTVLVKNINGVIEFEIVNSQDWTMLSTYLCGVYILSFIVVIVVPSLGQRDNRSREKTESINHDAILLSLDNREIEISFVDNIRQAETVVEYSCVKQT